MGFVPAIEDWHHINGRVLRDLGEHREISSGLPLPTEVREIISSSFSSRVVQFTALGTDLVGALHRTVTLNLAPVPSMPLSRPPRVSAYKRSRKLAGIGLEPLC